MTLTFDFLTSKWYHELCISWLTSSPNLNLLWIRFWYYNHAIVTSQTEGQQSRYVNFLTLTFGLTFYHASSRHVTVRAIFFLPSLKNVQWICRQLWHILSELWEVLCHCLWHLNLIFHNAHVIRNLYHIPKLFSFYNFHFELQRDTVDG